MGEESSSTKEILRGFVGGGGGNASKTSPLLIRPTLEQPPLEQGKNAESTVWTMIYSIYATSGRHFAPERKDQSCK